PVRAALAGIGGSGGRLVSGLLWRGRRQSRQTLGGGQTMATQGRMLLGLGVVTLAGMLFGTAPAYAGTPAGACEANVTTVGRYCEVGRDPGCTCLFESGSFGCAYISEDVLSRHVYVYFPTNDSEPVDGRADVPTYFRARLIRRNGSVAVLGRRHYTSDWVRWWVQNPADLSWHQQNTGVHGL